MQKGFFALWNCFIEAGGINMGVFNERSEKDLLSDKGSGYLSRQYLMIFSLTIRDLILKLTDGFPCFCSG